MAYKDNDGEISWNLNGLRFNSEASEIIDEFQKRHGDVLRPLIARIHELVAQGNGDDLNLMVVSLRSINAGILEILDAAGAAMPGNKPGAA